METHGGLGTVGEWAAKLSGGVVEVSIAGKVDLAAELQKVADSRENPTEKVAIGFVINLLKGL